METAKKRMFALQNELGKISKDSTNPFFNSRYFDINALLEHLHPLLEKHQFLLMQPIVNGFVSSVLYDTESDERFESSLRLPELSDPQKIGSCITYYRRYTLASLIGLQVIEDDGNKAAAPEGKAQAKADEGNKPWLNKDDAAFADAKKAILAGTHTVDDVRKKYKVSKEVAKLLTETF